MTSYQRWREALATANDPEFLPIECIDNALAAEAAQFWGTDLSALVTHIIYHPGGAVAVEVIAATGNLDDLIKVIAPQVESWAQTIKATHIKIPGRRGWTRALKPHGWRHFQDIVIKDLRDG